MQTKCSNVRMPLWMACVKAPATSAVTLNPSSLTGITVALSAMRAEYNLC